MGRPGVTTTDQKRPEIGHIVAADGGERDHGVGAGEAGSQQCDGQLPPHTGGGD